MASASEDEVNAVLDDMKLISDLQTYLDWLNSPDGEAISGEFQLGYQKRSIGVHPSTISKKGTCPLRVYYEASGELEPKKYIDSKIQLVFDIGTMTHVMLQAFFKDMYQEAFEPEVPLNDKKLMIKSHTDGRFTFPEFKFLLEIKSIKEGGSYGVDNVRNKPMKDHIRQAHCYMWVDDTPFCNMFYFCKNTSEVIEHPIAFDQKIWKEIEDEVSPVVEAVKNKEPPNPKVGSQCRDCPFLHGCKWGDEYVKGIRTRRDSVRGRGARR